MNYYFDPHILFGDRVTAISGKEARIICPHPNHKGSDTNASFNMETGAYVCFGNCQFRTFSVETLCAWLITKCGIDAEITYIQDSDLKQKDKDKVSYRDLVNMPVIEEGMSTHTYLLNRGITNDTIRECDMRSYNDNGVVVPLTDLFSNVIGCNIRFIDKRKMRYQTLYRSERQPIYPMHKIDEYSSQKPLCIVEGMFGYFNALQSGIQAISGR